MTDDPEFPDRNLDTLHERTASMRPGRHSLTSDEVDETTVKGQLTNKVGTLISGIQREGGQLVLVFDKGTWTVAVTFGKEAPDSDMAGGASYGVDISLNKALTQVLAETGWDKR